MKRRRAAPATVSADDAALFRSAIGEVRAFEPTPDPPRAEPPAPRPRQRELDEAEALETSRQRPFALSESEDALGYSKPGVAPRLLRRLKQGQYSVQDEIDLHGLTAAAAENVLRRFLLDARQDARHCLRVIHGKGLHSAPDGPVLRTVVERHLRQRADVLAFAQAPAAQGGSGALLVLLAPRRPA